MANIKVHHGAETLCANCEYSLIYERRNGERAAFCNEPTQPIRVPLDVVKCSEFRKNNTLSSYDMEKIAWTIATDKSGQKIGFKPPEKQ